jgi:hypothetical protein
METGAIRKRTRRLRVANPLGQGRLAGSGAPPSRYQQARPRGYSAILRKHAEPPPRASYQR